MRGLLSMVGVALCCLSSTQVPSVRVLNGKPLAVDRLDAYLTEEMSSLGLPGLSIAIINDGRIAYHRVLGVSNVDTAAKVTDETLFDAGSMAKTPFAFLVLKLAERGVLSLDTPLHTYLPHPDIAYDDRYKQITARMILSHSSGLPNWRFQNKDGRLDIKFTPGTGYLYSGEGYEYLANVIAHLEGVPKNGLQNVFEREVAAPFEWRHASYTWNDYVARHQASGHVKGKVARGWGMTAERPNFAAAFSLQTEAVGYARFMMAMMRGAGLRKATYDDMMKPRVPTDMDGVWYGLGLRVKPSELGAEYRHGGYNLNFSSGFMFNAEQKFGYVFFTNCEKGQEFDARLGAFLATGLKGDPQ